MIEKGFLDAGFGIGSAEGDSLVAVFPVSGHEVGQTAAVGDGEVGAALGSAVALGVVAVEGKRAFGLWTK